MTEYEQLMLQQMTTLNRTLTNIYAVLNAMVVEGLVVLPDTAASDN